LVYAYSLYYYNTDKIIIQEEEKKTSKEGKINLFVYTQLFCKKWGFVSYKLKCILLTKTLMCYGLDYDHNNR